MDNKDSMLKEVFTKTFNEVKFNQFIINLLNLDMKERISGRPIVEKSSVYEKHIEYVKDIGKYTDENRKNIVASIVKLKCKPDQARTMQRNFIAKHLKDINADAAIVALYSENCDIWRISFVKLDYTFDINGLTENITPAKRYSYLIEPKFKNHTVQEQLKGLLFNDSKKPSVEEIENVFSVEVVTDEFFKMYRDKYLDLKEFLESNKEFIEESNRLMIEVNEFSEEFAKKLMGQIAFLYFLQKKGWLGVPIVPFFPIDRNEFDSLKSKENEDIQEIMNKVFKPCESNKGLIVIDRHELNQISNIEADWIANVFKSNLNHNKEWGEGSKKFIRDLFTSYNKNKIENNFFNSYLEPLFYEALNERRGPNQYYKRFNCKIPFLNGGLFEPIYRYDWKKINIQIPDAFFSNEENSGVLDFFDMYNFTMNEDEPLEKEVAVDPEMLGKIFENLLDVKERKSKGAFYTPREIVHYMCQESLINYLNNETKIDIVSLELFIKYGEVIKDEDLSINDKEKYRMPKFIVENLEIIDKALESVTVADPSVGSGAFPLGMLNEIVKARSIITEYLIKELDNEWDIKDLKSKRSLYTIKKNAMKKSIFAVDIEPSAVDITKLRLWLSLVVDADVRIVNTLPNLDYNIMVGNSLIEEFKGIKLFDEELLKHLPDEFEESKVEKKQIPGQMDMSNEGIGIKEEAKILFSIQKLQSELFGEKNTEKKKDIKKEIGDKEWELIGYKLARENKYAELRDLGKVKKEKRKPYFLWKLEFSRIFKEKGGFDIVIGNPPYIDSEDMVRYIPEVREYCKQKYKSAKGNWDIFIIFIELGIILAKKEGNISYIVPNKLIGAKYSEALRKYIGQYSVQELRDYSTVDVFKEADVYPVVFRIEKTSEKRDVHINIMEDKETIESNIIINKDMFYRDIYWDRYFVDKKLKIDIIEKVIKFDSLDKIAEVKGAATVGEAYDIKEVLYDSCSFEHITMSKFINTGTIDRYVSLWGVKDTKYIKDNYSKPCILADDIKKINKTRYEESKKPKIIIGGMNKELECYLDKDSEYLAGKSTTIVYNSKLDLRYIIGIMNSKLMTFYYRHYFSSLSLSGGYLRIGPPQIKNLPIAFNKEIYDSIIYEVDRLIAFYEANDLVNISYAEQSINEYVYSLYNISTEEINIIEEV